MLMQANVPPENLEQHQVALEENKDAGQKDDA
jgi:hypothetical protein